MGEPLSCLPTCAVAIRCEVVAAEKCHRLAVLSVEHDSVAVMRAISTSEKQDVRSERFGADLMIKDCPEGRLMINKKRTGKVVHQCTRCIGCSFLIRTCTRAIFCVRPISHNTYTHISVVRISFPASSLCPIHLPPNRSPCLDLDLNQHPSRTASPADPRTPNRDRQTCP